MNFAMATLGLKEMEKFPWEGREKSLPSRLSQFSFAKLRQPTGQTFFPIFQKNSAMATLGLKEMGKFLLEDREKGPMPCLFPSKTCC